MRVKFYKATVLGLCAALAVSVCACAQPVPNETGTGRLSETLNGDEKNLGSQNEISLKDNAADALALPTDDVQRDGDFWSPADDTDGSTAVKTNGNSGEDANFAVSKDEPAADYSIPSSASDLPPDYNQAGETEPKQIPPFDMSQIKTEITDTVYLTDDSFNVRWINESEYEFGFGVHFSLEKLKDGVWETLPVKEGGDCFIEIAFLIPPKGSTDIQYSLTRFVEENITPGMYRWVYSYYDSSLPAEDGIYYNAVLTAEFAIVAASD